jgi:isopentenyldiphosphate isomerase
VRSEDSEELEVVDDEGKVIGLAERAQLHGDPSLTHRVVHVLVFNNSGELLLQKRSLNKDVAPGKWDTSVGGHINPGEDVLDAAKREMEEELGIKSCDLKYLYCYLFSNDRESEFVATFSCKYEGGLDFNREEIDDVAFWSMEAIKENLGKGVFSGHFEEEIRRHLSSTPD